MPASEPDRATGHRDERQPWIVETLVDAFADLMQADENAFRVKFRKMAADPFAFYRGSACLFYADLRRDGGPLGRRADQPGLDPGRPPRRELRHLHGRRGRAGLRRQRLRRGLPRALHLGPAPVRRQRGAAGVAEGPARRRRSTQLVATVPAVLCRPGASFRRERPRPRVGAAARHRRRSGAGCPAQARSSPPASICSTRAPWSTTTSAGSAASPSACAELADGSASGSRRPTRAT